MIRKRKNRVKIIVLTAVCIFLVGVSVLEGVGCYRLSSAYSQIKSERSADSQMIEELTSQAEDYASRLREQEELLSQVQEELNQTKKQIQNMDTQAMENQGTISPSTGNSLFSDMSVQPGSIISEEEARQNPDAYFTASAITRDSNVFGRINGKSYVDNENISLEELRYLTLLHYNFDHQVQVGEMIVNVQIQDDVLNIFKELFVEQYEIQSIYLIDNYWQEGGNGADADNASIEANNTSCFCYRPVTGGNSISNHGYGRAIDINPQQNPYVYSGYYSHSNAAPYIDRDSGNPHVIVASDGDICYSTFIKYGFSWGGNWTNPIDYQHFEKTAG